MPFRNPEEKRAYDRQYWQEHKYAVIGETASTLTLRHPKTGQELRVAKSGLSPSTLSKLRGFPPAPKGVQTLAQGGPVEDTSEDASEPANDVAGTDAPDDEPLPSIADILRPDNAPDAGATFLPQPREQRYILPPEPQEQPKTELRGPLDWPKVEPPKEEPEQPYAGPIQLHKPGYQRPVSTPTAPTALKVPPHTDVTQKNDAADEESLGNLIAALGQQFLADRGHIGMPKMPEFPGQPDMTWVHDEKQVRAALGVTEQAAKARDAKATEQYIAAKEQHWNSFQKMMGERQAKLKQLQDDIANTKINPDHWWTTRSNGQKAAAALGMILGGLSQGLGRGGPNYAMQIIDKAIDQDIDAQKMNLANKNSRLSMYMQETRDLNEAQKMAAAELYSSLSAQLQANAARLGSAQAMLNAKLASAELDQKAGALLQSYGYAKYTGDMQRAQMQLQANIAASHKAAENQKMRLETLKDIRELSFPGPDGKMLIARGGLVSNYKVAQEVMERSGVMGSKLKELHELFKQDPHGIMNMFASKDARAQTIEKTLMKAYARMTEGNRMSDQDQKFYSELIGTIRGFHLNPAQTEARLQELMTDLETWRGATLHQRSVPLTQFVNDNLGIRLTVNRSEVKK